MFSLIKDKPSGRNGTTVEIKLSEKDISCGMKRAETKRAPGEMNFAVDKKKESNMSE